MHTGLVPRLGAFRIGVERSRPRLQLMRLALAAAAIPLIAVTAMAQAATAATNTNQRFLWVFTGPGPGTAIATGLVNGVGTIQAGDDYPFPVTVSMPQGDLYLLGTIDSVTNAVNPFSCVDHRSGADTYVVTGGTGAFAGATGTGHDVEDGYLVLPRNADGSCNLDADPVAGAFWLSVELNLTND